MGCLSVGSLDAPIFDSDPLHQVHLPCLIFPSPFCFSPPPRPASPVPSSRRVRPARVFPAWFWPTSDPNPPGMMDANGNPCWLLSWSAPALLILARTDLRPLPDGLAARHCTPLSRATLRRRWPAACSFGLWGHRWRGAGGLGRPGAVVVVMSASLSVALGFWRTLADGSLAQQQLQKKTQGTSYVRDGGAKSVDVEGRRWR